MVSRLLHKPRTYCSALDRFRVAIVWRVAGAEFASDIKRSSDPKILTATVAGSTAVVISHAGPTPGAASHGGPIVDHVSFIDQARSKRCTVDPSGAVDYRFLRGSGYILRVSGCALAQPTELQSFWYHTDDLHTDGPRAAEEDARGIGPDGQPVARAMVWGAPPHFFRKERAFVLYLGSDPAMLAMLAELLGPQFAGR